MQQQKTILQFISLIIKPNKAIYKKIAITLVVTLLLSLLMVCLPFVLSVIIKQLSSTHEQLSIVMALLIGYGLLWMFIQLLTQFRSFMVAYLIEDGLRNLSLSLFDHLHTLSLRFHLDRKTGEVLHAIERAQNGFETIVWGALLFIVPVGIELIAVVCVLSYYYGILLALGLLIVMMSFIALNTIAMRKIQEAQKIYNEKRSAASAALFDSLLNVETVRYFSNQQFDHDHCDTLLQEQKEAGVVRHYAEINLNTLQLLTIGFCFTVVTGWTGWMVMQHAMDISAFILINGYFLQFIMPLQHGAYAIYQMRKGMEQMAYVHSLLSLQPEIHDHPQAIMIDDTQSTEIIFDHVSFGYDEHRIILKDISFTIAPGKTVAIVGPSGSGKSTIARLLFRFFETTSGSIKINGHDIKHMTQASLHASLGIVPQQVVLFNNTIHFNIAYGNPHARRQEVMRAAHQAQLDNLIAQLPDGYETQVGERGLKLSGGENQRIAIARVLLKNPSMYIFDEATSALDTQTEYEIHRKIREISFGATTLIIAHRLSTISHADMILVLDKGAITERGSHDELLMHQGLYAKLWQEQMN